MKIFAISLGCAKNSIDTELILGALSASSCGSQLVAVQENADVILINTCGFIESAVQESVDTVLEIAQGKTAEQILVVAGCLVQRYGLDLQDELGEVDIFHGTSHPGVLIEKILMKFQALQKKSGIRMSAGRYDTQSGLLVSGRLVTTPPWRAFVKIAEGCSNHCTYCLIPSIRGKTVSRPSLSIIEEIRALTLNGVREVTLLAQDLTSYRHDGLDLAGLVGAILKENNIPWLRLLYLHPTGITDELLQIISRNRDRICPYLDIPVQHAASDMLKLMGRGYDASYLTSLFARIRTVLPDVALRTTVMVGFPGETEAGFRELLEFIRKWKFMHLGCFMFSDEEECMAHRLGNKVDIYTAEQRKDEVMEIQAEISSSINRSHVGSTHKVLIEGTSAETELLLQGRTMFQAPDVDGITYINSGNTELGEIVDVKITDSHVYDLVGEIIERY